MSSRAERRPPNRQDRARAHVRLDKSDADLSIQKRIVRELRKKNERLRDLFRQWDCDSSNSISKEVEDETLSNSTPVGLPC